MSFIHLQKTASADEMLESKRAFKRFAHHQGVSVSAYPADNGIFHAHAWVATCNAKGQALTFAGVNSHHQNGTAEQKIKELQELAWTMLINANK